MSKKATNIQNIRLELDFVEILRARRRWNIYLVIATEDPRDTENTLITTLPSIPIKLRKMDSNRVDFEPEGSGETHGLFVLERTMPEDHSVRARMWLVQSRNNSRRAGEVLAELGEAMKGEKGNIIADTLKKILGGTNPWIAVGQNIIGVSGLIGDFLKVSKDRNLGFISMDERFTQEEIDQNEVDRVGFITSTGKAGWTWVIG